MEFRLESWFLSFVLEQSQTEKRRHQSKKYAWVLFDSVIFYSMLLAVKLAFIFANFAFKND